MHQTPHLEEKWSLPNLNMFHLPKEYIVMIGKHKFLVQQVTSLYAELFVLRVTHHKYQH